MNMYKKIVITILCITQITIFSNPEHQGSCESLKKFPYVDKNKILETYNQFALEYNQSNKLVDTNYIPDSLTSSTEKAAFQALQKENIYLKSIESSDKDFEFAYKLIPSFYFDNEYNWGPGWFNLSLKYPEKSVNKRGTTQSLRNFQTLDKNFIIDAYNEFAQTGYSSLEADTQNSVPSQEQLAYQALKKENRYLKTEQDGTTSIDYKVIPSDERDNAYAINWDKYPWQSGFITQK